MAEQVQIPGPDTEAQIEELTSDELEHVSGGAGTRLASVTDLVIDPFNPQR
jgi:bacteriocin-like protein